VDETRAVTVAWEMWQRGDFLVPYLNGQPYSHKPPLLQWCIHLSWLLFGVNEWSARLVAPLFALGNLALTAKLARRLWPGDPATAALAPLILLAMPVWALWSSLTLYDMLTTFFTLLGLHGIVRAASGEARLGWSLAALAIGLGALSKGPAILVMVLPPALFAPWWRRPAPAAWESWYGALALAVLLGALLALAWALPAGLAGGEEYRRMILWGQSAGRINQSFAHPLPFWWYAAILPVLWLPWTLWPPLWRSLRGLALDSGLRFCAAQALFALAVFSLISGKRIHYLLPLFPAMALAAARALSLARPALARRDLLPIGSLLAFAGLALLLGMEGFKGELADIAARTPLAAKLALLGLGLGLTALPWRRPATPLVGVRVLALTMLGLMLAAHWAFYQSGRPYYSMQAFADRLATVEREGAPVAHWEEYHGDFTFLGRLRRPLAEIAEPAELLAWMRAHPQGYVVLVRRPDPAVSEEGAEFAQFYRGTRRVMLWKSAALLARPEALGRMLRH
jgi:4-amino-4-deoxy-L-arabinose transferase-like glycosyltransferase